MKRVVIAGIGFALPYGVGSSLSELDRSSSLTPREIQLSGGETLFHFDMPEIKEHRFYPDRKQIRHMRPDAIYAYITALLAMENAQLSDYNHTDTSYYTSTGQCYGDMSPFIKAGLEASQTDGAFDLQKFGRDGRSRVNPFFSIRTLGALPMALVANTLGIHGENYVTESFGAESVSPFNEAVRDIQKGKSKIAIVAAQDYLLNSNEMDNLFFNSFFSGDFRGSSSATTIILEEWDHNQERNGKRYAEVLQCKQHYYPVAEGNKIVYPETPFQELLKDLTLTVDEIHLTASGTENAHNDELSAVTHLFPHTKTNDYYTKYGTLLAGSEPFGSLMHALTGNGIGLSLSRSVCGLEASVLLDKGCSNV